MPLFGRAQTRDARQMLDDVSETGTRASDEAAAPEAGIRPTVLLCLLIVASMSFNLGYDIGILSGAKRLIQDDLNLSDWQVSLLVGALNLVSAVGGLFSGQLADTLGRRRTVAISCAVCTGSVLMMAVAGSFSVLMLGRVLDGLGVGSAFQVAPLYIAEMAPKRLRGRLMSSFDLFINVGILAGYIVGWALSGLRASVAWRLMVGVGALPSALVLCALPLLPESPRYLLAAGRADEAEAVLRRVYAPAEAQATLVLLQTEARCLSQQQGAAAARLVRMLSGCSATGRLVAVGMGVALLQQATGVEAAVYYTPETLERAGIRDEQTLLLATVGIGALKTAVIVVAAMLVDRFGRVPLMVASNAGITVAQTLIGASFALGGVTWMALLGQALFMGSFSIGVGPCAMMVAGEVCPLSVRGVALGGATFLNRCVSGTVAIVFISLTHALTPQGTFFMFAAIGAFATWFTWRFVPETKGRSLEEIARDSQSPPPAGSEMEGADRHTIR
jgi:sugar porter (SP) family MFS transporter